MRYVEILTDYLYGTTPESRYADNLKEDSEMADNILCVDVFRVLRDLYYSSWEPLPPPYLLPVSTLIIAGYSKRWKPIVKSTNGQVGWDTKYGRSGGRETLDDEVVNYKVG